MSWALLLEKRNLFKFVKVALERMKLIDVSGCTTETQTFSFIINSSFCLTKSVGSVVVVVL